MRDQRGKPARLAAFAAAVLLALPIGGGAQEVEEAVPEVAEWIGSWMGRLAVYLPEEEDGGTLTLTISQEDGGFMVQSLMISGGAPPGGPVIDWKVEGADFSYRQWFEDVELAVVGKLEDGALRGEMIPYRGREKLGAARFVLRPVVLSP